ncbi:MAG: hypothetical protein ABIF77_13860 [bacterium]
MLRLLESQGDRTVRCLAYWYALAPLHGLVFSGMLRGIARAVRR